MDVPGLRYPGAGSDNCGRHSKRHHYSTQTISQHLCHKQASILGIWLVPFLALGTRSGSGLSLSAGVWRILAHTQTSARKTSQRIYRTGAFKPLPLGASCEYLPAVLADKICVLSLCYKSSKQFHMVREAAPDGCPHLNVSTINNY